MNSISKRISLKFSAFLTVLIILVTVAFFIFLAANVRLREHRDLVKTYEDLENIIEHSSDISKSLEDTGIPYFISFLVYDNENKIIVGTNDPFLPLLKDTEGKAKKYMEKNYFTDSDLYILYYTQQTSDKKYTIECAFNLDQDAVIRYIKIFPKALLIILLPVLILSYIACLIITKQTLKPITNMTREAEKISASNLDHELPVTNNKDELDELALTFNKLFARLKKDFDRERAFTSNVSHELKTPLAVIQGNAKLLLRWGKDDRVQLEKSLKAISDETSSMTAIISNLLELSRLENGRVEIKKSIFSADEILLRLREDTASYSPLTEFLFDEKINLRFNTDKELLYQVFNILVNNSIKFCDKEKCIISVSMEKCMDEKIKIVFSDNGPGIEEKALPHVFERFYRADESHNRQIGGSGLGLSIAKEIMHSLGGDINVFNDKKNYGAVFTITL